MKSSLVAAGVLGSIILMKTNNNASNGINTSIQDRLGIKSQKAVTGNVFKNEKIKDISDVSSATLIALIPDIINKFNEQLTSLEALNVESNQIEEKTGELKLGVTDGNGNFIVQGNKTITNTSTNNIKDLSTNTMEENIIELAKVINTHLEATNAEIVQLGSTVTKIGENLDAPYIGTTFGGLTISTPLSGDSSELGILAAVAGFVKGASLGPFAFLLSIIN
jgi:hypothetical protein